MADRKKAITELESIQKSFDEGYGIALTHKSELVRDVLELLKEQDELLHKKQEDIDRLCNEISEWKHKFHDKLLKEQEDAVKPTWCRGKPFCGACGLRIHGGKFCCECGKPIAWEGR